MEQRDMRVKVISLRRKMFLPQPVGPGKDGVGQRGRNDERLERHDYSISPRSRLI